jgi:hypothetical protein
MIRTLSSRNTQSANVGVLIVGCSVALDAFLVEDADVPGLGGVDRTLDTRGKHEETVVVSFAIERGR